jgi:dihydropyrimidinase
MTCHGVPTFVIVKGRVCVEGGKVTEHKGLGQFVPNLPYAPYVYDAVHKRDAVSLLFFNLNKNPVHF